MGNIFAVISGKLAILILITLKVREDIGNFPQAGVSLNSSIFREYDVRGVAGKDLAFETARALGKAGEDGQTGQFAEKILTTGVDLGVAHDGNAERLGVVDDRGNIVWGDKLMMILFWREILPRHPGALVIIEVKCSQSLVDEVVRLKGKPFFYRTGHSLIKAEMRELNAPFTGEMSGHMFFADEYYGFDDAFYATGRLLRILSYTEKTLAQLLEDIPKYYSTAETRIPCADRDKFAVVARLVEKFSREYEVIAVDGARVLFGDVLLIYRFSLLGFQSRVKRLVYEEFQGLHQLFPEIRLTLY